MFNGPQSILMIGGSVADTEWIQWALGGKWGTPFELTHAYRFSEGLRKIKEGYDIVLWDSDLPGGPDLLLLNQLITASPQTPILILSDFENQEVGDLVICSGADDFLVKKQIPPRALARIIRQACLRKKNKNQKFIPSYEIMTDELQNLDSSMHLLIRTIDLMNETPLNSEQRKCVDIAQNALQVMKNNMNFNLDTMMIAKNRFISYSYESFSLGQILKQTFLLSEDTLNIKIDSFINEKCNDQIKFDLVRFKEIIYNFIYVLAKYLQWKTIRSNVSQFSTNTCVIEFMDTGFGSSSYQTEKAFNLNEGKMFLVKNIIEHLGGKLIVKDDFKFEIHFPVEFINISGKYRNILIIDDEIEFAKMTSYLLECVPYRTVIKTNGKDGINALKREKFDLAICDIGLPDINGLELIHKIRESGDDIPFIITTGFYDFKERADTQNLTYVSIIEKPYVNSEFLELVQKMMTLTSEASKLKMKLIDQGDPINVLVVDDADDARKLIQYYARNMPYKLFLAENGKSAVDLFLKEKIDIIFMDLQMPIMNGFDAIKEIREIEQRENRSKAPIFALTAYSLPEDIDRCLSIGATNVLLKPIKKSLFHDTILKYSNSERVA